VDENQYRANVATLAVTGISGSYSVQSQTKLSTASGCGHSAPFEITSGGTLRLKSSVTGGLSAETCTGYTVTVKYSFSGGSTTCRFEVATNDVNEGPRFGASTYRLEIEEGEPEDTAVGSALQATDPDRGQELTFSIVSGNTGSSFRIGSCSGQIYTTTPLDYDAGTRSFTLGVKVTDSGSPAMSS